MTHTSNFIVLTAFILCANLIHAQTDIIEYKSHSGSLHAFKTNRFRSPDHLPTNFGMGPSPRVRTASLDSVKLISDSVAVMYTSEHCFPRTREEYRTGAETRDARKTSGDPGSLWRAGADTVYNHPLFSQAHSLDSIKEVLGREYYFQNPVESIVFVGFDNCPPHIEYDENGKPYIVPNEELEEIDDKKTRERRRNKSSAWWLIIGILGPLLLMYVASPVLFRKASA